MTGKTDYTDAEWQTILEAPPSAGMIVLTAQRGGTFRETLAIGKAYGHARAQHGASQLLDEIISSKPQVDRTHYHSLEELTEHGLEHVRDAVAILQRKATPEEVDDYRRFVLTVAQAVAGAHEEEGAAVSPAEQAAIDKIASTLGDGQPA